MEQDIVGLKESIEAKMGPMKVRVDSKTYDIGFRFQFYKEKYQQKSWKLHWFYLKALKIFSVATRSESKCEQLVVLEYNKTVHFFQIVIFSVNLKFVNIKIKKPKIV